MPSEAARNMGRKDEIQENNLHVPTQLELSLKQKKFGWE